MAQVSAKLRTVDFGLGRTGYGWWCPGCEEVHAVPTSGGGSVWDFNGDLEKPTFSPSVKVTWCGRNPEGSGFPHVAAVRVDAERDRWESCCHVFIRAGQIEFCGDSTHALAGKTVELPDLPERLKEHPDDSQ